MKMPGDSHQIIEGILIPKDENRKNLGGLILKMCNCDNN